MRCWVAGRASAGMQRCVARRAFCHALFIVRSIALFDTFCTIHWRTESQAARSSRSSEHGFML